MSPTHLYSTTNNNGEARELFYNVPHEIELLMYLGAAITALIVIFGTIQLLRVWFSGKRELSFFGMIKRALRNMFRPKEIKLLLGSRISRKGAYSLLMHWLILLGIIGLGIGTTLHAIHGDIYPFIYDELYDIFVFFTDISGLLLVIGTVMAIFRRYVLWRGSFEHEDLMDGVILVGLLFLGLSGFLIEIVRIAATNPAYEDWSIIGTPLAAIFEGIDSELLEQIHLVAWVLHIFVAYVVLAYLPYSKLFHMFGSIGSILLLDPKRPKGLLKYSEGGIHYNTDLTFEQLIQLSACVECHRCNNACPAHESGEPLSPMLVVRDLNRMVYKNLFRIKHEKMDLHSTNPGIASETLWACTTCRACEEECPTMVQHMDIVAGMRAHLVEEGSNVPETLIDTMKSLFKNGNLFGQPKKLRFAWAEDLQIPLLKETESKTLLYVGCTGCYDPRNQKAARELVNVLRALKIDFGILGKKEKHDGDTARRLGEISLFEKLMADNTKAMNKAGVKKIITFSPHSYNTFLNEYSDLDTDVEIIHYTKVLADALAAGKLEFNGKEEIQVTFHDPCYLGRYNEDYETARQVLEAIPGIKLVEMPNTKSNSFCCGGGGGGMFQESKVGARPSEIRVKEAVSTKSKVLVTACPFCTSMFTDAAKSTQSEIEVKDLVEVIAERLKQPAE